MSEISIQSIPAHDVFGVRATVRLTEIADLYDRAFPAVSELFDAHGTAPAHPARAYYFGVPGETIDLLVGFPVSASDAEKLKDIEGRTELTAGLGLHHFDEMTVAQLRHEGGYDGLPDAWSRLHALLNEEGRAFDTTAIGWEEYVTEPSPDADPATMVTLITQQLS